jgi:hypothetical protein
VHNRARRGEIKTKREGGRRLYYIEQSAEAQVYHLLPMKKYRANSTFIVWITFTTNACQNYPDTVSQYRCDHIPFLRPLPDEELTSG